MIEISDRGRMMSDAPKKKFRLIDAIMTVICVVFVAEAASPVAAIGNSQYFWWIFLLIAFLLPYGLIVLDHRAYVCMDHCFYQLFFRL